MRKLLLTLFILFASIGGTYASPTLSEDFESSTFPPSGWTTHQATGCKGFWSKASYKTDAQLKQYITGYTKGGDSCARVNSSSLNNIGKVNPSSWLISPMVSVGSANYLHFMLSYNYSYNGSSFVTDPTKKMKFEVLISSTSTDTLTFTDVIYTEIPSGVKNWSEVTLDLSKYAGKDIYIAFHEFGTPQATPFLMNNLYIDDVKVNDVASSDIFLSSINELSSGTKASQPLTVNVKNTGMPMASYQLGYQVGTNEPIIENVNTPIGSFQTAPYTFTKNVELLANGDSQKITVWCHNNQDSNFANDTTSTSVEIFSNANIPYTLGATASTDFASSAKRTSGSLIYGWGYYATTKCWVYTSYATPSYLYTTKSYTLPKGKLKVKIYCTATEKASMNVYLTQTKGKFDEYKAGSETLITSLNAIDNNFYIDVPEDGNYIISFLPTTMGQVALFGLDICTPYDDVIAQEIISPATTSMIAQANVPITIKLRNDGIAAVKNVKVNYKINNGTPIVETISTIDAGTSIEHTFATKADFSKINTYNLVAWSELSSDGDIHNDTVATTLTAYLPKAFPYSTSFETEEDKALWMSINVDGDDTYWGIENVKAANAIDGTHASYINYEATSVHKDFFISPAINLVADTKARVAFYYATQTTYGGSKLAVYLTKSLDPDSILAKGIKLDEVSISRLGYNYFAAPATVKESGTYYVAIYNYGGKDALFLDDFRFDAASELALVGLSSSETSSKFDLDPATIQISIKNCGVTPLTGGTVAYTTYKNENGTLTPQETVSEFYSTTIQPDSTYIYSFNQKANISTPGTYDFVASLKQPNDADSKNNSYACTGPTLYATKTIPYIEDFENATDRASIQVNGKWQEGTSSLIAYNGTGLIQHTGIAATDGDWVYLNRVHITPGTYNFSFFWKTATSNVALTNRQNFVVYLGNAANPDSMKTELFRADSVLNATVKCNKELFPLTIAEAGNYYIGIKCTTPYSIGNLNLDNFRIESPTEGREITKTSPYVADFANKESEWYHYHPTNTSYQWTAVVNGSDTYMSTKRTYTSYNTTWKTPGIYESPAFKLNKGDKIVANFKYSMAPITGATPDGTSTISLMLADKDLPTAFTTVVASGKENMEISTANGSIEIPADGVYYFGFVLDSGVSTTFNVHSCELSFDSNSGINSSTMSTDIKYSIDANDIFRVYDSFDEAQIFGVNGAVEATTSEAISDLSHLQKGIHIVRIVSKGSITTGKIILK